MADEPNDSAGVSFAKFLGGGGGKFLTSILGMVAWTFLVYTDKLKTWQDMALGGAVVGVLAGALVAKDIVSVITAKKEVPNP